MIKVNVKDLKIKFDLAELVNVKDESKVCIGIDGKVYINDDIKNNKIIIAKLDAFKNQYLDLITLVNHNFKDYKPTVNGTICEISPLNNWNAIIDYNKEDFLYYDHQSDGVEIFEDSIMEDIGWNASPLEISYRDIAEFIEENCDGTLVCYDNGIQFNGFAVVDNIEEVREKTKMFIYNTALKNIEDGIVDVEDDDVIESMEYFGIKG